MWSSSKFLSNFSFFFFRFWLILLITFVLWCQPHVIWLEIQSLALMWGYSQKSCALLYLCSCLNLWVFVYISEFKLWCIFLNWKLLEFRVFHITSKLSKAILLQLHYNSYYTHTHTHTHFSIGHMAPCSELTCLPFKTKYHILTVFLRSVTQWTNSC